MSSGLKALAKGLTPVCLTVLLGGCALLPAKPVPVARPAEVASAPFALNGRIGIEHRGKHHSAGLRWTHLAGSDEILLLAPLGQTAARVYRDAQQATLDDGDGHHQAADAETLMEQVLGWHLPLSGLHQWVLGMPDGDGPAQVERDGDGRITVLHQAGWEVRYLRYDDTSPGEITGCAQASAVGVSPPRLLPQSAGCASNVSKADSLPSRLQLKHEDLQIQLLVDEWDWDPQ